MKKTAVGGLGQWVEERCLEGRMSLRQAGEKTGLSHATIADIIKGVRPSAETIRKLAEGFGGDGYGKLAVEDKLLYLAGYRTPRPDGEEPSEALAQLLDKLSGFSQPQLEIVGHFIDFISPMEKK